MIKTILFSIVFVFITNMSGMSYEFIDPKKNIEEYKKRYGYLIPLEAAEKILIDKNGSFADSILFLINAKYEKVRDEMRKIVLSKMGIAYEVESVTQEYMEELHSGDPKVDLIARKTFNQLNELGIKIDQFTQYRINTSRYNIVKKIKGYSLLEIKIIEGKDVFNKECTLLIMTRTDCWRDWGRESHIGIWIPIKVPTDNKCVTDTEIGMAERLKDTVGIKDLKYFLPKVRYAPLMDVDMMREIKEELETF